MTDFIQLHLLTAYPPSNLNRDDTGRPKTVIMGGVNRLRVSSQSLKRAFRTSQVFADALGGHLGIRTKRLGTRAYDALRAAGLDEAKALAAARALAEPYGKIKGEKDPDPTEVEQMVHVSPEELAAFDALVACAAAGELPAKPDVLTNAHAAVDIAMFGRMLAARPEFNRDAAVQVAHAFTTHHAAVEDDYFTAVDDLNRGEEDRGAGHVGAAEFGAGLFYLYICVDRDRLVENLQGDEALARDALAALVEAAATVAPRGKQNSFASRARAAYVLAERGPQQPRSLALAFLKPVGGRDGRSSNDFLGSSIKAIEEMRDAMDKAYGGCADGHCRMDVPKGEGSLAEVVAFVTGPAPARSGVAHA